MNEVDKTPEWFKQCHEWMLAIEHSKALKSENFEVCDLIQKEIDRRIEAGTINHGLMQGFRYYNRATGKFEGEYKFNRQGDLNGLFDNYEQLLNTNQ